MSEEEQLQQLLVFASSGDRICPQPGEWDAIWRLPGQPCGDLGPPLILSGWAFSTDREKRERFAEHFDAEAANSALESCSLCQASFPQAVGKDRKMLGAADREPVRDI